MNGLPNGYTRDEWFIRLSDDKEYFLHPVKETDKNTTYEVKKGMIRAGIWSMDAGILFIKNQQAQNLELINIDALPNPPMPDPKSN